MRGALRNVEQDPDGEEGHHHGRAAVTHERKCDSRDGKQRGVHHDINESLDGNPGADPRGEQHAEFIGRVARDLEATVGDGGVQEHDDRHAYEAEFLRSRSKNKVIHRLGKPEGFLNSLRQPLPPETSASDRDVRLFGLPTVIPSVSLCDVFKESLYTGLDVVLRRHGNQGEKGSDAEHRKDVFHVGPSDVVDHSRDRCENDG